ncbi:MAG: type II secretion system protein N, partial [Burkholderiaceae bacterium]|nr:type II secretion system protein N [Burkholderiaceae bacterium]
MRLRGLLFVVVAVASAVTVTLVQAPAQWLAALVHSATGARVLLAEPSGTLWSGKATLVLSAGGSAPSPLRASLPEPLSWRLSPWALLAGRIDLTLSHPSALAQPLTVQARLGGRVDIGPARLQLPAALLIGLGAPWNTIRPGGVLVITWDKLTLDGGRLQGHMTGEWQLASSALTPVSPFGHYRVQTNGVFPGTQLNLVTVSGPLELTGSGTIGEGGRLRFQGLARAAPGTDPAVKTQ